MASRYKVGDVLLCHKHIGVAKFVGRLRHTDYQQLSSQSQTCISPSDTWIGLQLVEEPDLNRFAVTKPNNKPKPSHSHPLRALSFLALHSLPFADYFSAHYGLLIPKKLINGKINVVQVLSKLTELFHALKRSQQHNASLSRKVEALQSELSAMKRNTKTKTTEKRTKTKSRESIIYDHNGNEYRHREKVTHTTTHSFKSEHVSFSDGDDGDDTESANSVDTEEKQQSPQSQKAIVDGATEIPTQALTQTHRDSVDNATDTQTPQTPNDDAADRDSECSDGTMKFRALSPNSDSASHSNVSLELQDNYSDRHMSDEEAEDEEETQVKPLTPTTKKMPHQKVPTLTDLLSKHSFNPEQDIICEDNEEDYAMASPITPMSLNESEEARTPGTPGTPIHQLKASHRNMHSRRFSAPWDSKKKEFGSDYEKMHSTYWKISGNRALHLNYDDSKENANADNNAHLRPPTSPAQRQKKDKVKEKAKEKAKQKHEAQDSADWRSIRMQMLEEDPETNRIYRLSRVHQQSQTRGHKRSASVVHVPRYFIEIDYEYPDLPDL